MAYSYTPEAIAERFWAFVPEKPENKCWVWAGYCRGRGAFQYGRFSIMYKRHVSHRVAWELTQGPIPEDMFVLHTCDNPPCVNPDHLFLGTKSDNAIDRNRKGRNWNGPNQPHHHV